MAASHVRREKAALSSGCKIDDDRPDIEGSSGDAASKDSGFRRSDRSAGDVERVNDFDTAGGRSLGSEFWFLWASQVEGQRV